MRRKKEGLRTGNNLESNHRLAEKGRKNAEKKRVSAEKDRKMAERARQKTADQLERFLISSIEKFERTQRRAEKQLTESSKILESARKLILTSEEMLNKTYQRQRLQDKSFSR